MSSDHIVRYHFTKDDGDRGREQRAKNIKSGRLTPKQEHFLQLIAEGNHINHSYQAAYGCSKKAAGSRAYTLLKKPHMQKALDQKLREAGKRQDVTIDEVIGIIRRATKGAETEGRYSEMITGAKALGQYIGMWEAGQGEKRNPFQRGEDEGTAMDRLRKIATANKAAAHMTGKDKVN